MAVKRNTKIKGLIAVAKGTGLNIRAGTSTGTRILFTARGNQVAGTCTGQYFKKKDGIWIVLILPREIGNLKLGMVRIDVTRLLSTSESNKIQDKGKKLLNNLVSNNLEIYDQLTRTGAVLDNFEGRGIKVSKYKKTWQSLLKRLQDREKKLKNSRLLKTKEKLNTAATKVWQSWKYYVLTTGRIFGVGAIPAIVIGVIIGGGLAVTAYIVFKPDYDESKTDLKISVDLDRALKSLDPKTAQAVKENLEKQVDDAFNKGKTQGTFSGMFKMGGTLAVVVLGFVLVKNLMGSNNSRK